MSSINREYKDRLFRFLFGAEEMRENILQLYNALNSTNYLDVDSIKIYTIDDVLYIEMKNDVAIILDSYLHLWEQQSSYNPNMPLRGLMYFGKLYSKYIEENNINIYGSKLCKIPAPRYFVFYNGVGDLPAIDKLKLSDAFIHNADENDFQWTATVYNLNKGKNDELLKKCKPLEDYITLINSIREYEKQYSIEEAVDKAVDECISNNIMADILRIHKAEVKDMVLTEFNKEVYEKGIREEGIEEGIEKGSDLVLEILALFKEGYSIEEIVGRGFPREIVEKAKKYI